MPNAAPASRGTRRQATPSLDRHPVTPDGRYFVVRARLWRMTNPALPAEERERLVRKLMRARRDLARPRRTRDRELRARARRRIAEAKVALGERGPVWWNDGAPDYNRHLARTTPYAAWYERLMLQGAAGARMRRR